MSAKSEGIVEHLIGEIDTMLDQIARMDAYKRAAEELIKGMDEKVDAAADKLEEFLKGSDIRVQDGVMAMLQIVASTLITDQKSEENARIFLNVYAMVLHQMMANGICHLWHGHPTKQ